MDFDKFCYEDMQNMVENTIRGLKSIKLHLNNGPCEDFFDGFIEETESMLKYLLAHSDVKDRV